MHQSHLTSISTSQSLKNICPLCFGLRISFELHQLFLCNSVNNWIADAEGLMYALHVTLYVRLCMLQ